MRFHGFANLQHIRTQEMDIKSHIFFPVAPEIDL